MCVIKVKDPFNISSLKKSAFPKRERKLATVKPGKQTHMWETLANITGPFRQESNGVLISIINDKWQRSVGGLVLGDDKLVDAQVSGCQGGLFGCHPSRFLPGTVHYSPCEMPLYIAWWCEQGGLNNTAQKQPGACCSSHSPEGKSHSGAQTVGGMPLWEPPTIRLDRTSPATHEGAKHSPVSCARSSVFLLGILVLATSLASLPVSLPTEPLIKRGFV